MVKSTRTFAGKVLRAIFFSVWRRPILKLTKLSYDSKSHAKNHPPQQTAVVVYSIWLTEFCKSILWTQACVATQAKCFSPLTAEGHRAPSFAHSYQQC